MASEGPPCEGAGSTEGAPSLLEQSRREQATLDKGDARRRPFVPPSQFAPCLDRSTVETATGAPRDPTAGDTPQTRSQRSRPTSERLASPMRRSDRRSPTLLLVTCAFVLGIGAGAGGLYLVGDELSVPAMRRLPWIAVERENAAHIGVSRSIRGDSASGAMRSSADKLSGGTDSQALSTLSKQVERQLAEGRLDRPAGNNALDTYRQIVALAPHAPATLQLGDRLSVKVWSLATQARATEQWDDALYYFEILKTLPAVPLAAYTATTDLGDVVPAAIPPDDPTLLASGGTERPTKATNARHTAKLGSAVVVALPPALAVPVVVQPLRQDPASDIAGAREAVAGLSVPPPSAATVVPPAETRALISMAMARGDDAIGHGDVISARSFYELAASNGSAQAATAVGRTYDPIVLRDLRVWGLRPDTEAAKRWYEKAIEGGDADARPRLERLLKALSNAGQ
jgi:hypothetical protein